MHKVISISFIRTFIHSSVCSFILSTFYPFNSNFWHLFHFVHLRPRNWRRNEFVTDGHISHVAGQYSFKFFPFHFRSQRLSEFLPTQSQPLVISSLNENSGSSTHDDGVEDTTVGSNVVTELVGSNVVSALVGFNVNSVG